MHFVEKRFLFYLFKKFVYPKKRYRTSTYSPQAFSIPRDVINYMTKNWRSKSYSKLFKTCRFFYVKGNNDVGLEDFIYHSKADVKRFFEANEFFETHGWITPYYDFKFRIYGKFYVFESICSRGASYILKNVRCCELTHLYLKNQILLYCDYIKLTESRTLRKLEFHDSRVYTGEKNKFHQNPGYFGDGRVRMEDLLLEIPQIAHFQL